MFLSCLFVRVMTRPIRHLSYRADRMTKGDLAGRGESLSGWL